MRKWIPDGIIYLRKSTSEKIWNQFSLQQGDDFG